MEKENIFEIASRRKIRFDYKGQLSVSDLWDLDVQELDIIFKILSVNKRQVSEESLLQTTSTENTLLNMKIDIIKHIVDYKLKLEQANVDRKAKADKKEKVLKALENLEDNSLNNMTKEELQEMLD